MDKIMIGDIVKVDPNNAQKSYSVYLEWFNFYHVSTDGFELEPSLMEHLNVYDEDFIVKWIGSHLRCDVMLYAIKGVESGRTFLVERDVIAGYYHTKNSSDCCYDINERLLVQEVIRLRSEIDTLKEKVIERKEAKTEKLSSMPPLKNGMFGITRSENITSNGLEGYEYSYFCVIKEQDEKFRLVYDDGMYDIVGRDFCGPDIDFNFSGVNDDETAEIVCLMNASCFSTAKDYFRNEKNLLLKPEVIWERYPDGC